MASRSEGVRTPGPSFGITEPAENEQEKMARESRNWLLGTKKKKVKTGESEIDYEQLENELMNGLEDEIKTNKDTSKDVEFKQGW